MDNREAFKNGLSASLKHRCPRHHHSTLPFHQETTAHQLLSQGKTDWWEPVLVLHLFLLISKLWQTAGALVEAHSPLLSLHGVQQRRVLVTLTMMKVISSSIHHLLTHMEVPGLTVLVAWSRCQFPLVLVILHFGKWDLKTAHQMCHTLSATAPGRCLLRYSMWTRFQIWVLNVLRTSWMKCSQPGGI